VYLHVNINENSGEVGGLTDSSVGPMGSLNPGVGGPLATQEHRTCGFTHLVHHQGAVLGGGPVGVTVGGLVGTLAGSRPERTFMIMHLGNTIYKVFHVLGCCDISFIMCCVSQLFIWQSDSAVYTE